MWKIGQVMSVGVGDGAFGYGFNVTTSRNQPLVLFAYETREAAEAAAQQVEAAVERAVSCTVNIRAGALSTEGKQPRPNTFSTAFA